MMKRLTIALLLTFSIMTSQAWASNLSAFNQAVAQSYHHYRATMFYLRTGNPMVAGFEITEASQLWQSGVMPFATDPPDAFSDDPDFAVTLEEIDARLSQADSLLMAGGDEEAIKELLAPLRGELAALRNRNGVIVFSDHVDAANAAMERLWVYRHEPPDWADIAAFTEAAGTAAITIFLYEILLEEAPPHIADDPEFQRIMEGSLVSLQGLMESIQAKNTDLVISYLREMRSFDRILWLQFG